MNDVHDFSSDIEQDPYWPSNSFWKTFLSNEAFDHAYFVDVFKTVCGDCQLRNSILRHFLGGHRTIYNRYQPGDDEERRLTTIRQCIKLANCKQRSAYVTWEYPSITDERGYQESHCIMLIYDPVELEITAVDSRGPQFARNYCVTWGQSYSKLRKLFSHCTWIDVVPEDLQLRNIEDHFCQTWSLLLTIEIERSRNRLHLPAGDATTCSADESDSESRLSDTETTHETCTVDDDAISVGSDYFEVPEPPIDAAPIMRGYTAIIAFWRQIVAAAAFREAIYYELYRYTHLPDGKQLYNRYFTTLEALVTRSNTEYYPHGVEYTHTGYTFIEDFLDALTEETLQRILT
jgi:hypothetical protein